MVVGAARDNCAPLDTDVERSLASSMPSGKLIAAATVGNALEFYDFITFAFFAVQIGHAFFPPQSTYGSLMASLAIFGAGFLTRPIGGFVLGAYADRVGRRPAMTLSFLLMGVAIVGLAITPTYKQIGMLSPILATLARLIQGFSLGGEVGPTTAYLLEIAPQKRRGFVVSWQSASQSIAATVAGLVGAALSLVLAPGATNAYGWRIAFLIGAITIPFGLWSRRSMPETLRQTDSATDKHAVTSTLAQIQQYRRIIIIGLAALAAGTICNYIIDYITTFAENSLHMLPGISLFANGLSNFAGIIAALGGGLLSDRIGRRPVLIWSNLALLVAILPIFLWMVDTGSLFALLAGATLLGFLGSVGSGVFYTALVEILPKAIRARTFATVYAISIAIFGGSTQFIVTGLIHITANAMAPAWYLLVAIALGQVAIMFMPESAPTCASGHNDIRSNCQ